MAWSGAMWGFTRAQACLLDSFSLSKRLHSGEQQRSCHGGEVEVMASREVPQYLIQRKDEGV